MTATFSAAHPNTICFSFFNLLLNTVVRKISANPRIMSKVLHIRSSSAGEASTSTKLGLELIARIPGAKVTVRDVAKNPPTIPNEVSEPKILFSPLTMILISIVLVLFKSILTGSACACSFS